MRLLQLDFKYSSKLCNITSSSQCRPFSLSFMSFVKMNFAGRCCYPNTEFHAQHKVLVCQIFVNCRKKNHIKSFWHSLARIVVIVASVHFLLATISFAVWHFFHFATAIEGVASANNNNNNNNSKKNLCTIRIQCVWKATNQNEHAKIERSTYISLSTCNATRLSLFNLSCMLFVYVTFGCFVLNVHTFNRSSKFPAFGRVFHELCTNECRHTHTHNTERQIALVVDEIDTKWSTTARTHNHTRTPYKCYAAAAAAKVCKSV